MVDFRWHTASLVAVFLALGVGVLMGGAAVGDGSLRARQQAVMRRIEAQFATLRQDQLQLADARRYAAEALPWIVDGRLSGRTVAVLAVGDPGATPQVTSAVALAGARSYTIDVPAGLAPATAGGRARGGPAGGTGRPSGVAADLAGAVFGGGALPALEADGAVLSGGPLLSAGAVVVLAGPKAAGDAVDRILAALVAARPASVPIVGAVPGGSALAGLFTGRGLALVDDVRRPAGQAALVLCLTGIRGRFGDAAGDAGPLPPYGG